MCFLCCRKRVCILIKISSVLALICLYIFYLRNNVLYTVLCSIKTQNANGNLSPKLKSYNYLNYTFFNNVRHFSLPETSVSAFVTVNNKSCFTYGTNLTDAVSEGCSCYPRWAGSDCGIPRSAFLSQPFLAQMKNNITRRQNSRRVINAININNEFELFEVRVHELKDVVDVFLICESSYTTFGEKKPLWLLERLHDGFLKEFQHKFLYVFLDHFPPGGYKNGWIADDYIRTYLSKEGLKRLKGMKKSDLFILNDADEIPRADDVIFLKFYDGFGEPISLWYRWNIYGFFWQNKKRAIKLSTICTVGFLQQAYHNDAILLRRRPEMISPETFKNISIRQRYRPWSIGSSSEASGWHCSWCFPLKEFPVKLRSAQSDDGPRWGDYPEKYNLNYIKHLIKTGLWFDNRKVTVSVNVTNTNHAPSYVLKNFKKFKFLVFNPYRN